MTEDSRDLNSAVGIANTIVQLASDSPELTHAGRNFAKSALTISKAVNNVLLPIAAVNFAFDKAHAYFTNRFESDLEDATRAIPSDEIVEPAPSVAAPALQGLAFSHEQFDLKLMYLNLLRTAMDRRCAANAHPAYAGIISQLTPEEARLFSIVASLASQLPIVTLDGWRGVGIGTICSNILDIRNNGTGEQISDPTIPTMIDNWLRLGLITIDYGHRLIASGKYDWVKTRPEYIDMEREYRKVKIREGIMELSAFGRSFADAVSA